MRVAGISLNSLRSELGLAYYSNESVTVNSADFKAHLALAGEIQTAPRRETYIFAVLLDQPQPDANIVVYTDNEGVFNDSNSDPLKAINSTNTDFR